jgi:hypothetical protein
MSYYILPKNNTNVCVNPISSKTNLHNPYLSCTLYNYYNEIREQIINILQNCNDLSYNTFDEIIKIVNPYEYIFSKVPGSKFSVSKLKPKTNLFYDFLEVLTCLNIFEKFVNKKIKALHITKNSNDTVECFEMLREGFYDDITYYDKLNEDSLKNIGDNKFDFLFFETNENCINRYINNVMQFTMTILRNQNNEGVTVIKINNIFYKPIVDVLYLLTSLFEKVYIIKPNTSNITTFDKYIVCKNFIFNEKKRHQYKVNYLNILIFLKKLEDKYITSLLDFELPYYFITKLDDMNVTIGQQQLEALDQIISILKNKNKDDKIETIKKSNLQKSVNWCEKYKIPCNKFAEKINIFLPIIKEDETATNN